MCTNSGLASTSTWSSLEMSVLRQLREDSPKTWVASSMSRSRTLSTLWIQSTGKRDITHRWRTRASISACRAKSDWKTASQLSKRANLTSSTQPCRVWQINKIRATSIRWLSPQHPVRGARNWLVKEARVQAKTQEKVILTEVVTPTAGKTTRKRRVSRTILPESQISISLKDKQINRICLLIKMT